MNIILNNLYYSSIIKMSFEIDKVDLNGSDLNEALYEHCEDGKDTMIMGYNLYIAPQSNRKDTDQKEDANYVDHEEYVYFKGFKFGTKSKSIVDEYIREKYPKKCIIGLLVLHEAKSGKYIDNTQTIEEVCGTRASYHLELVQTYTILSRGITLSGLVPTHSIKEVFEMFYTTYSIYPNCNENFLPQDMSSLKQLFEDEYIVTIDYDPEYSVTEVYDCEPLSTTKIILGLKKGGKGV